MDGMIQYRTPEQFREWLKNAYEECRWNDAVVAGAEAQAGRAFDDREQMLTYMVVTLSVLNRKLMERIAEMKRNELPAPMTIEPK